MAELGVSAGWQHRNSSWSVSSRSRAGSSAGGAVCGSHRYASLFAPAARVVRTPDVDESARRYGDQPGLRAVRQPLVGPREGSREQRLLYRVLGGVEVPVPPSHRAQDPRRELTQQILDG